jgi:hypothetical protein
MQISKIKASWSKCEEKRERVYDEYEETTTQREWKWSCLGKHFVVKWFAKSLLPTKALLQIMKNN